MRKLLILALLLALVAGGSVFSQESVVPGDAKLIGATFGVTLNKAKAPELTYSLTYQAPGIYKWTGGLFEKAILSVVYQQKGFFEKSELYAARVGGLRGVYWKQLYVVYGVGTWYLAHSDGNDYLRVATMLQMGIKAGPLDIYVGWDAVDYGESLTHYTFGGFLVDL